MQISLCFKSFLPSSAPVHLKLNQVSSIITVADPTDRTGPDLTGKVF